MMSKPIIGTVACSVLAGCASTPDVQYHYFAAQATTSVLVAQTVECRADQKLSVVNAPTVTTTYSSNRDKPRTLRTTAFKSSFADTNIKFDWFDDGRLKSVNTSYTGQGETVVKAALALVGALGGGPAALDKKTCDDVSTLGGGKAVTLAYEATMTYAKGSSGETVQLTPTANSKQTYAALQSLLPKLAFRVNAWTTLATVAEPGTTSADATATKKAEPAIAITLNKTALAPVDVLVNLAPMWSGTVVVPTDETYQLPIPQPKPFGGQQFALALNEAGGITSLGYVSTSGTAAGFNTLTAIAGATAAPSDADKAGALKAQADLIAQTTRLAACQAKPAECK